MTSPAPGRPCVACDAGAADRATILCPACKSPLPPHPQASPFERLGLLPPRGGLDAAEVERAWLQRSRQVHPDRYAQKEAAVRRAAAEQTAALNDAHRILRSPFERAIWLVGAQGIPEARLPQTWLVALMEAREEAEAGDAERQAVIAAQTDRFETVARTAADLVASLDEARVWEQPAAAAGPHGPALRRLATTLAEQRTLARLVADLGGPTLIPSLAAR